MRPSGTKSTPGSCRWSNERSTSRSSASEEGRVSRRGGGEAGPTSGGGPRRFRAIGTWDEVEGTESELAARNDVEYVLAHRAGYMPSASPEADGFSAREIDSGDIAALLSTPNSPVFLRRRDRDCSRRSAGCRAVSVQYPLTKPMTATKVPADRIVRITRAKLGIDWLAKLRLRPTRHVSSFSDG